MPGRTSASLAPILNELQSGRTRELLLLLQDSPVPEVVDPLNLQSGLSSWYEKPSGDYQIMSNVAESTTSRPTDNNSENPFNHTGLFINPNENLSRLDVTFSSNTSSESVNLQVGIDGQGKLASKTVTTDGTVGIDVFLQSGTEYYVKVDSSDGSLTTGYYGSPSFPYTGTTLDITDGLKNGSNDHVSTAYTFVDVTGSSNRLSAYVTGQFSAPTDAPADFKQWNAIRAEDVTTGGSTSPNPVEFELLDSLDTVLTTSRIPASEIADQAFALRNREWQTTASAGQTAFTIPETGSGGHYGIPILSAVTVSVNGTILNGAWSFDGTDTITLDESASDGDTVTVAYDFDLFDATLQPRAYLSRESSSEASPSISHFRYEYVV